MPPMMQRTRERADEKLACRRRPHMRAAAAETIEEAKIGKKAR